MISKKVIKEMKKNKYKISIIVPVYNKSDYLEQCIDSILLQSYENLELLLVDDESTDGSGDICERYAKEDERVRVFHQKNGGPTAACITGMEHATGDYYMFIDSDDYVSKDMLKEMYALLIGKPGEIVCCNHVLEKKKETVSVLAPIKPGVYEGAKLKQEIKENLIGKEERTIPMSRCMKLCEKSVFEGNEKYYDTAIRMGDDFNLICPALLNSTRIVMMEEGLFYHYRYVEDSIVHRYDPNMKDSIDRLMRSLREVVKDKGIGDGEAKVDREYCYMLMLVMKNELRNPKKNYAKRIEQIFMEPSIREKVISTPLSVRNRSNQFMYLGMQYPQKSLLGILRMIIKRHDRK